jgi:hypothetical protein
MRCSGTSSCAPGAASAMLIGEYPIFPIAFLFLTQRFLSLNIRALTFLIVRHGEEFITESRENAADMCASLAYRVGSEDLLLAVLGRTTFENIHDGVGGLTGALERNWTRVVEKLAHFIEHDVTQSAVRVAAIRGRVEGMRCLLRQPGANPAHGSNVAIRESLENGHVEIAMMLLEDSRVRLDRDPKSACILLCSAIRCPKDACLFIEELFARFGPDVIDVNCFDHTPLRLALCEHNFRALRQLLLRPDIDMTKSEYSTLLALASDESNGCKDVLDIVLRSSRFEHHFGRNVSPMKEAKRAQQHQQQKKTHTTITRAQLLANEALDSLTSGEEEGEEVVVPKYECTY